MLGFEYGYSVEWPEALVLWEAQFGDFANGAQVIVDQFIASAEDKWRETSRLGLLLPHGSEGQGPEHSSARIERYLQLCADGNMQVCNVTTPAQYFHLLRRQMRQARPKPLVLFTPKSLLRLPAAASPLEELDDGRLPRRASTIPRSPTARPVERVLLCSGKVYYDLQAEREKRGDARTAIVRVEQLYPFPARAARADRSRGYPRPREPSGSRRSRGTWAPWSFVARARCRRSSRRASRSRYVGRVASAVARDRQRQRAQEGAGGASRRRRSGSDGGRRVDPSVSLALMASGFSPPGSTAPTHSGLSDEVREAPRTAWPTIVRVSSSWARRRLQALRLEHAVHAAR